LSEGGAGVLLMRTWSDTEAALVRQLLEGYGIPCQVVSDVPHTVLPISVNGLGEVRILVPRSRLEEAKNLLADHRRQGMELVSGSGRGEGAPGEVETEPPTSEPDEDSRG
jgi:hypothetical protein